LIRILYLIITLWLSLYGFQALLLTVLYLIHRSEKMPLPAMSDDELPLVAVQLPIYNEKHVVRRLIDAAVALDYPRDRLLIQVLDDSTDDTTRLAEARAAFHRARGTNVQVVHRAIRDGYKAGALKAGAAATDAPFLAVFDADFLPQSDFLRRTIPFLAKRPELAAVQTRWTYLNDVYSPLTRAQSIMLDGHFVIEQTGRNRSGLLMAFNGSGGIWRAAAVQSAGGWQADTVTEDMDLSYRAEIAGWQILYLPDVEAPSELPPQMEAFKQQQARWARGSMQTLRKLWLPLLRSRLTFAQKAMALVHMSAYLSHPLIIALLLVSIPILLQRQPMPSFLVVLGLVGMGPPLLFLVAQRSIHPDGWRRLLYLPVLALVGLGIALTTSRAVWQGLTQWGGTFRRTPKFRIEGHEGRWNDSLYRLRPDRAVFGEVSLALYALGAAAVAWSSANYAALPYLLLYAGGFGLVAGLGLFQGGAHH
jgi:cellulose synthase/poly-beta-1,6-N-acetylglucosamine synthase-like glycosyltransferase